jgi:class 3 adenylate cyclase
VLRRFFGEAWGVRSIDGRAAPDSLENRETFFRLVFPIAGALMALVFVTIVVIPAIAGEHDTGHRWRAAAIYGSVAMLISPFYFLTWRSTRFFGTFQVLAVTAVVTENVAAYVGGPKAVRQLAVGCVAATVLSLLAFRRRVAVFYIVLMAGAYAVLLSVQDGNPDPASDWTLVVGAMLLVGIWVSWIVERLRVLAESERVARADLAELNATLEERVADQVEEINRVGELKRFLSPQVAAAVMTAGESKLLEPHRRQVAVFFCDLRGFTSFVGGVEPEEVVEILGQYYEVAGAVIRDYDATVGTFAGDGIMAYFNDPVPCDDPAGQAVDMSLALREPMALLISGWARKGFDLGYGVGIAYGYATLGMIGFEGRNDYTPVGSVVNVASRLCDEAGPAEILIDQRTYQAVGGRVDAEPVELTVKGIATPLAAYRVKSALSA